MCLKTFENAVIYKEITKRCHDKGLIRKDFRVGKPVLLFNSRLRLFPGKVKSKWSGPFTITEISPHGVVELEDPLTKSLFKVNRQRLKPYRMDIEMSAPLSLVLMEP